MSIRKYIPDTITSMNLLCGVMGVIFTLKGRPDIGFMLMLGGAFFDFFDGLSARLLKASSGIGKELDSLADMVSFGVLPALMLFWLGGTSVTILKYIPLILAVFSALRLAKFNLDERQHEGFIGLPTPAAAMVCGSLACFVHDNPGSILAGWCGGGIFIPVLALVLSILLVCEVPMFSMKFGGGNKATRMDNLKRLIFIVVAVLSVIVVAATGTNWSMAVLASFIGYIFINLVFAPVGNAE